MKSWVSMAIGAAAAASLQTPARADDGMATAPQVQIVRTPATARLTATGTLTVRAVLTTNKDLPAGTTVNFSASSSVSDTAYTNSHSVSGTAKVVAGKVSVTLKIPYSFLVVARSDKVSISLFANSTAVTSGPTYAFSSYFLSTIALPANGAATVVKFSGSI